MIDTDLGWKRVEERLARTTDPRHRLLLEVLRDHLKAEAIGDFDLLLSTLRPDPEYHFWVAGNGFGAGPKGLDQVTQHYRNVYAEGRQALEYDIERIVVDDDCIVTEGWFRQVYPGRVLQSRGMDAIDDADGAYLLTMRCVLFWPYDADGKLTGEDSYSDGDMYQPGRVVKLDPSEIPPTYFQLAAG